MITIKSNLALNIENHLKEESALTKTCSHAQKPNQSGFDYEEGKMVPLIFLWQTWMKAFVDDQVYVLITEILG